MFRRNEPILKARVIPFPVVVGDERGERPAQVGFPKDDDSIQAFLLDRSDESLRVRIGVSCRLHRQRAVRHKPFALPIPSIRSVAGRSG
jgi:hypothetical protein